MSLPVPSFKGLYLSLLYKKEVSADMDRQYTLFDPVVVTTLSLLCCVCCAVLCCAVLCCAVLCCAVLGVGWGGDRDRDRDRDRGGGGGGGGGGGADGAITAMSLAIPLLARN